MSKYLRLIFDELGRSGLFHGGGDGGDGMVVRATLQSREHGHVDAAFEVIHHLCAVWLYGAHALAEEYDAGARTAERLVRRRRHDITVFEWAWYYSCKMQKNLCKYVMSE